ncbi:hypothetical protein OAG56_07055 [Mariniblastus sp.]|nr:hypothetical protein [Mariniblastus sp.]
MRRPNKSHLSKHQSHLGGIPFGDRDHGHPTEAGDSLSRFTTNGWSTRKWPETPSAVVAVGCIVWICQVDKTTGITLRPNAGQDAIGGAQ